jgi:hypothetical protein
MLLPETYTPPPEEELLVDVAVLPEIIAPSLNTNPYTLSLHDALQIYTPPP